MDQEFDVIDYLSGLTNFVFDKSVLTRIALRRGIKDVPSIDAIDENTERLCVKDLLITVLRGPWSTASHTNEHGTFKIGVGQQTITSNALEEIKAQIRQLNKELGIESEDGLPDRATNEWVQDPFDL